MSYSQRFRDSITVRGSRSVSYPKSEHGGNMTVSYTETVPLDITVHVETAPFDASVFQCNNSIDVLTGSVVAMNTAQCVAIKETTEKVSTSLVDGFFAAINTELSQQLQALDSAIKASLGLIAEQGKAVTAQRGTMEADYQRISSRYVMLFRDLDSECYKRIYALDKQSFHLAQDIQKKLLLETNVNVTAQNLLATQEEAASKLMLLVSRMNRLTQDVLVTLANYVRQEITMTGLIDSCMLDEEFAEKQDAYIPVIYSESDNLESGARDKNCHIPVYIQGSQKNAVSEALGEFCGNSSKSTWKHVNEAEKAALEKELKSIAESSFAAAGTEKDVRVYTTLMELWQNSVLSDFAGSPV
jgi:hypothetical protein